MTIEQKALELDLIARVIAAYHTTRLAGTDANAHILGKPHVREAFDRLAGADKSRHAAEMREQAERFSEAAAKVVEQFGSYGYNKLNVSNLLSPFILAPVDPLADLAREMVVADGVIRTGNQQEAIRSGRAAQEAAAEHEARLRIALDTRGLAIVKKEAVNG